MSSILILFAHPVIEKSRAHHELIRQAKTVKDVYINDLYQEYPDFDIDINREKELLLQHDIIIWQHPFYWYSAPAMLKQWQDLVLEHGWAYGKHGHALDGKKVFNVITSGAASSAYHHEGFNKYPLHEFLRPFERTAELCKMTYWPPFWMNGVHRMNMEEIQSAAHQYKNLLTALAKDIFSFDEIASKQLMNQLVPTLTD